MSFRTVFMAVGAGQGDAEVDRAVTICNALGAHLSLLVLGIAPPPPASPYGVVSNDIWAGDIRQGQEDAATRAQAIERMAGALGGIAVEGLKSNLAFLREVMRHPAFGAGAVSTDFVERHKAELIRE